MRAFYFYLITQCFFSTGDSSLRLGWLECLEELENMHTYDWGGAMFEALIFALDQACRPKNNVGDGQCGGFTPLLQVSLNFLVFLIFNKCVYKFLVFTSLFSNCYSIGGMSTYLRWLPF